ncbi:hypothetical protein LCGC14_2898330 [marine sediment metagenome]|uniref:Peptidase C39-like domain-containing protein n=1 Tax=marine sediment metagenome TaxID=412755 RepID=A0A0F9A327_9ZZZZ
MKLIKQPNSWSCMAAAAAMAFDCEIKDITERVGHDGNEVIHYGLRPPACFKGFHIQEIVDVGLLFGFSMTLIESAPSQTPDGTHIYDITKWSQFLDNQHRFECYLNNNQGILIGKARKYMHAVAFDKSEIYDPRGRIYDIDDCDLFLESLWIVSKNQIIPRK